MNAAKIAKSFALGATLLAATTVMAATENSGKSSVQLDSAVSVNGTQIPAGHYNLKWTTSTSGTELQFIDSKKAVTTVPAHVVELDRKQDQSSVDTSVGNDGSVTLTAIQFAGKAYALAIGSAAATAETPASAAGQK